MKLSDIQGYLLDARRTDWDELLAKWAELIPHGASTWILSQFGELFIRQSDGRIGVLQVSCFQYEVVASSEQDFEEWLDDPDKLSEWFLKPLVDSLRTAGKALPPDHCYSFIQPLGLGGQIDASNVMIIPIREHFLCFGDVFQQIKDVPDGGRVIIKPE